MNSRHLGLALFMLCACSKPVTSAPASTPGDETAGEEKGARRAEISAAACEADGGTVVGDIGDGAIHRADYLCPDSQRPPVATIAADPDGPMGVEGSVCCK